MKDLIQLANDIVRISHHFETKSKVTTIHDAIIILVSYTCTSYNTDLNIDKLNNILTTEEDN